MVLLSFSSKACFSFCHFSKLCGSYYFLSFCAIWCLLHLKPSEKFPYPLEFYLFPGIYIANHCTCFRRLKGGMRREMAPAGQPPQALSATALCIYVATVLALVVQELGHARTPRTHLSQGHWLAGTILISWYINPDNNLLIYSGDYFLILTKIPVIPIQSTPFSDSEYLGNWIIKRLLSEHEIKI